MLSTITRPTLQVVDAAHTIEKCLLFRSKYRIPAGRKQRDVKQESVYEIRASNGRYEVMNISMLLSRVSTTLLG
jgi:hypothetical protein